MLVTIFRKQHSLVPFSGNQKIAQGVLNSYFLFYGWGGGGILWTSGKYFSFHIMPINLKSFERQFINLEIKIHLPSYPLNLSPGEFFENN